MTNTKAKHENYYVPEQSIWPLVGSIGLGLFAIGAAGFAQGNSFGPYIFFLGVGIIIFMMTGWFSAVINESQQGLYSAQMDRSFRWGMIWFIFSEVMFFAAFFGALFYVREFAVPWLGGEGNNFETNRLLWSNFVSNWPLLNNPNPNIFQNPKTAVGALGLPAINTALLMASSFTITIAHHALKSNERKKLNIWLLATIVLGVIFLVCQVFEYHEAYTKYGLKLNSGIYGTTFYMLTGFHGAHVTIGSIMLIVMLVRCYKGHFSKTSHFAFEATAWYWHFVDVVWLFLFIYVYVLPIK